MKSLTAVCQTGASMPAINPNGRISRHPHHRGDGENAEMKMYLSKLKDLVPFMPKNRKLSKLEIIQHVIDYICDLQTELETHPEINNFDAAAALVANSTLADRQTADLDDMDEDVVDDDDDDDMNMNMTATSMLSTLSSRLMADIVSETTKSSPAQRQPLVDRQAPNTILPQVNQNAAVAAVTTAAAATAATTQQQLQAAPSYQTQTQTTAATKDSSRQC